MVTLGIGKYRINYLPLPVKGLISALRRIGAHLTPFILHCLFVGSEITRTSIQLLQYQDGPQQISLALKPLSLQSTFYFFLNICLYDCIVLCSSSSELNTYPLILGKYIGPSKKDHEVTKRE